ncbi:response regulator [Ekhidna sp. To15]|uniref:response regulator n=1 Tax=Ekhidna sp. To15 TaxID=3395267 RepID=UPI003F51B402
MRVLIVDDSTYIRSSLKALLTEEGYEVVGEAKNGEMAIDLAMELKPDVITLDNILPDMTGLDILKILNTDDLTAKVIMISAVGQQSAIVDAMNNGAKHYLVKPFDDSELIAILKQLDEET